MLEIFAGIEFLKEKRIFKSPLDPVDVVAWLKENPHLDKKRIADYICRFIIIYYILILTMLYIFGLS